ncbi:MAG TPA: hypothetical protein VML55_10500, partial [Planctomycetaceae bacterium]|nr:hypothetical protein [Planctomycetaceae bacterium]
MNERVIRQFGCWESPLSPASLAWDRRLDAAGWDSDGETLVWLEGRSGRGVLVAQAASDGASRDLTSDLSVRAEVGYGGGDFTVQGGAVYFVVHKTGRIYRQRLAGGTAEAVTPPFGEAASPAVSADGRWLAYVHHDDRQIDRIAVVDSAGRRWPQILAEGHDFFMQPRWSPDGRRFAFIAWDHPQMPWDGTGLYLAELVTSDFDAPRLEHVTRVAGGLETAIFQPEFTPDGGSLLYVSDETGWGRIYVRDLDSGGTRPITPDGVEHAMPAWVQDQRTYAVAADGRHVVAVQSARGFHQVRRIEMATGASEPVEALAASTDVTRIDAAPRGARVAIIGSGPKLPPRLVEHDFASGRTRVIARSSGETVPAGELSACEAISWTTGDGATAHGLYYPPASGRFAGSGRPPLVVLVHGGPTGQVR